MDKSTTIEQNEPVFDPLNIMGTFWTIFGVIVLFATLFVKKTTLTPIFLGIVVNILAGSTLLIVGIVCLLKARSKRQKIENE